jgi:hypothetical protein
VKAHPRHGFCRQPPRQPKAGSTKPFMSRANPFLFQAKIPLSSCINHKW